MKLKCHCGRWVGTWSAPVGGDGGQVVVACARCGEQCAECHGLPAFALLAPVRFLFPVPVGLRQFWAALWPQAS